MAAESGNTVIRGLDDFRRDLGRIDSRLRRELGRANKRIGERQIVQPARRKAERLGGGHVRLAKTGVIGSRSVQSNIRVALNAGRVPDAFGWEFGAKRYPQFPAWRGNQWTAEAGQVGYVLHPTIHDRREAITASYGDLVMDALAEAFPE